MQHEGIAEHTLSCHQPSTRAGCQSQSTRTWSRQTAKPWNSSLSNQVPSPQNTFHNEMQFHTSQKTSPRNNDKWRKIPDFLAWLNNKIQSKEQNKQRKGRGKEDIHHHCDDIFNLIRDFFHCRNLKQNCNKRRHLSSREILLQCQKQKTPKVPKFQWCRLHNKVDIIILFKLPSWCRHKPTVFLTWGRATSHIQHMIDPNISAKSKLSSTKNFISHTYCLPLTLQ